MSRKKVFVVDDSEAARKMLINILDGIEEVAVSGEAGTGQGSIIMLEEVDPDIVILETGIGGGMSVDEIIRELRGQKPEVKIILCTDAKHSASVINETALGAVDFISKPYNKQQIRRTILSELERDSDR